MWSTITYMFTATCATQFQPDRRTKHVGDMWPDTDWEWLSWQVTRPCWHQSGCRTFRPPSWKRSRGSPPTHQQWRCWTVCPRHASYSTCGCWTSASHGLVSSTFTVTSICHSSSLHLPRHTDINPLPQGSTLCDEMQSDLGQLRSSCPRTAASRQTEYWSPPGHPPKKR